MTMWHQSYLISVIQVESHLRVVSSHSFVPFQQSSVSVCLYPLVIINKLQRLSFHHTHSLAPSLLPLPLSSLLSLALLIMYIRYVHIKQYYQISLPKIKCFNSFAFFIGILSVTGLLLVGAFQVHWHFNCTFLCLCPPLGWWSRCCPPYWCFHGIWIRYLVHVVTDFCVLSCLSCQLDPSCHQHRDHCQICSLYLSCCVFCYRYDNIIIQDKYYLSLSSVFLSLLPFSLSLSVTHSLILSVCLSL